jgi:hypothetical protein
MKAYLEFSPIDEETQHLAALGFEAQITDAYEMENGFIAVLVDWSSKVNSHKFKYPSKGCTIHSSDKIVGVELVFEDCPYRADDFNYDMYPSLIVSLNYEDSNQKMDFVCFHNLKYQAVVYFAPETWNCGKKIKKIEFQ